jgi:hypothetical protein
METIPPPPCEDTQILADITTPERWDRALHQERSRCPQLLRQKGRRDPFQGNADFFIPWEQEHSTVFEEWWETTSWPREHLGQVIYWSQTTKQSRSQGRRASGKRSDCWLSYRQCAREADGMPFVECIHCHHILRHPIPNNIGVKHLSTHLLSKRCERQRVTSGQSLKKIFSKKKVYLLFLQRCLYL